MKNQKGFSLIELLIVVVVIGVIAAIAIPNLLASRRAANEGSAISSLRTYHSAQLNYQSTIGSGHFAGDDGNNAFITLGNVYLLDEVLGSGLKSGYSFWGFATPPTNESPATFFGYASPTAPLATNINHGGRGPVFATIMLSQTITVEGSSIISSTGSRKFALATDGVIYYETTVGGNDSMSPSTYSFDERLGNFTTSGYVINGGTPLESQATPPPTPQNTTLY